MSSFGFVSDGGSFGVIGGTLGAFGVGGGEPGEITHGRQITASNTGFTAYNDGEFPDASSLTLLDAGGDWVSDFFPGSNPVITGYHIVNDLIIDKPCTFNACWFEGSPLWTFYRDEYRPGGWTGTVYANYCTVTGQTFTDQSAGPEDLRLFRCNLSGESDAIRDTRDVWATECYARVFMSTWDPDGNWDPEDDFDHCDVWQSRSAGGSKIIRCNFDSRPSNRNADTALGPSLSEPGNSCFISTEGSTGAMEIRDNYFAGGNYTIYLSDFMDYTVVGNEILDDSWGYGPLRNDGTATIVEFSGNVVVDADGDVVDTLTP